jgi:hypothetical protein
MSCASWDLSPNELSLITITTHPSAGRPARKDDDHGEQEEEVRPMPQARAYEDDLSGTEDEETDYGHAQRAA